jgi:hypothetical protein
VIPNPWIVTGVVGLSVFSNNAPNQQPEGRQGPEVLGLQPFVRVRQP